MGEDFIRTVRAKGAKDSTILLRHALRNAAVSIVTIIGIGVASMITGVVVTGSVFNLPGPATAPNTAPSPQGPGQFRAQRTRGPAAVALAIFATVVLLALFAPLRGTVDPVAIDPAQRLAPISAEHWLGTDVFGRDTYSRVLYGARVSLIIGLGAMVASIALGLVIGVVAGYFRVVDAIVMRVMDGVMAIPGILLAIALVSLTGSTLLTVLVAITVPEVPRVVRLVRGVILG